ncbi:phosphotransferase [Larkinella soli]|uniref:phosphotransferase n=1 Tax=Larkinella soli TaxID=1770527 RepID=UPI000FFBC639|nr:phosphotransferase [Larkinella soli]
MLLTGFNLAHYLMDKGYLSPDEILDGTYTAHPTSSRNTNFLINRDTGSEGLFVKQVQAWDQEKILTLRSEATCYWLANQEDEYAQLKAFLPRFIEFDQPNHILITGAVPDAISLNDFYLRERQFPPMLAVQQAELLCSFHKDLARSVRDRPSFRLFRRQPPTVFHWSASGFSTYGGTKSLAEQQMIQLITRNSDYTERMAAVRDQWETSSLIHGDIKPANFLVVGIPVVGIPVGGSSIKTGRFDLRLIDWETADIGDPCWDVAAVFQSYLFYWIYHEPAADQTGPNPFIDPCFSLEAMQPSMQMFWKTYARNMDWSVEEARDNLKKTVGYCAMKLIHTCFESIQQLPGMPLHSARMLQLSLNMLTAPEVAAYELFGL